MPKLVMMKGLPASGKSTRAKELVAEGYFRVNRDSIREMISFGAFRDEHMVVDIEKYVARAFLQGGEDVVIDDCNLNPGNEVIWRAVAKESGAEFYVNEVDTDVEECVARDAVREKKVGEHVIRNMALEYGLVKIAKEVVVCDIDGTIADIEHRRHYVSGEKKDWKGFFSEMMSDTVRSEVEKILQDAQDAGKQIIFVSARPETYRDETNEWLLKYVNISPDWYLLMRRGDDKRDDTIVKSKIYDKYLKNLNIVNVIDDRPKVSECGRIGVNSY